MEVRELTGDRERRRAVPVLRQLWTDRDPDEIHAWTGQDEYHLVGGFVDGTLVSVAGVQVAGLLHHARQAWLYDLVVDEPRRGEGYGATLVDHVGAWARERDCEYVALASPLEKGDTHDFYDAREYERWGYVPQREL
ncbi:MAG: GNAT family N-acetyltransferase [Haloarculaceae archaeon]